MTFQKITEAARRFAEDESGATAVEYAILASLIAGAIIAAVSNIGTALSNKFNQIADTLSS